MISIGPIAPDALRERRPLRFLAHLRVSSSKSRGMQRAVTLSLRDSLQSKLLLYRKFLVVSRSAKRTRRSSKRRGDTDEIGVYLAEMKRAETRRHSRFDIIEDRPHGCLIIAIRVTSRHVTLRAHPLRTHEAPDILAFVGPTERTSDIRAIQSTAETGGRALGMHPRE